MIHEIKFKFLLFTVLRQKECGEYKIGYMESIFDPTRWSTDLKNVRHDRILFNF